LNFRKWGIGFLIFILMIKLPCKICGNDIRNAIVHTKERMLGLNDPFDYLECGACGCVQLMDIPADMQKYYPPNTYYAFSGKQKLDRSEFSFSKWIRKIQADYKLYDRRNLIGRLCCLGYNSPAIYHYLRKINARYDTSILDIGCGNGGLLFRLKEIGFRDLTGADPFLEKETRVPGLKIFKSEVFGLSGKYDFIMMNHAFEHMDEPVAVLKKVYDLLADDGCLMLRVPVSDAYCWLAYREFWASLDPPRHFFIYSTRSMGVLASKTGFTIKELLHDATAFQFWGSEQYIKGISLISKNSYNRSKSKSIFSKAQIRSYRARIAELNKCLRGGDAVFFLYKELHEMPDSIFTKCSIQPKLPLEPAAEIFS
jgi:SAM-dependent methyltransferase